VRAAALLADIYSSTNRLQLGLQFSRRAYDAARQSKDGDDGAVAPFQGRLGIIEYQTGHINAAIADMKNANTVLETSFGDHDPQTQIVRFYLASALCDQGKNREAEKLAETLTSEVLARNSIDKQNWPQRLQALQARVALGSKRGK